VPLPPAPQAPFQLNAQQQANVDRLLKFWEMYSARVKRYRCQFTRYEYDSIFGPSDRDTAKTISEGQIAYESPDKGMFKVDEIKHHTPQQDGKFTYVAREGEQGEHWICDGQAVFEYDYVNKQLEVQQLPPDMQGLAIADGPLPFLFGAKAEKIKSRYWVRIVAPPEGKEGKEYWLQAFPKTRQDAAVFRMVEVILDAELFLPSALQVYDLAYNPPGNFTREVFVFHDRKVNEVNLNPFKRAFFKPAVPFGWKKVVQKFTPGPAVTRVTPPPQRPDGQAGRPVYDYRP
jgi:TIGR03009 family protein